MGTLEERVAAAKAGQAGATPVEAAQQLLALVAALDTHDPLTRGHSDRVRAYAQMIAEEMHLSSEEVDLLNWAALLHDIGKLDVPTEILAKEGRPTDDEWAILKRHPEFGGEIVAPLRSWLGDWTEAVTQHHERWDGKGYPAGTAGEEIALAGRIVAIADVFDVITSARSYKDASDALAGREEIARCAGAQFDPKVVRAFLGISLGRLRFAMGPLSWLSHAPLLGRLPLTPAIGTVSGALAVATAALTTGIVAPPPSESALAATQAVWRGTWRWRSTRTPSVVLRVPGVGTERNVTVRIVRGPSVGIGHGGERRAPPVRAAARLQRCRLVRVRGVRRRGAMYDGDRADRRASRERRSRRPRRRAHRGRGRAGLRRRSRERQRRRRRSAGRVGGHRRVSRLGDSGRGSREAPTP